MSYTQLVKDTLIILDLTIYFEEFCLSREINHLPETCATTLQTFKRFLTQTKNLLCYSYSA